MSLSGLLSALVEYAADEIVECGFPEPDRMLRYHGVRGLPHDCCTEAGLVVGSWRQGYATDAFPRSSASSGTPCPGYPMYVLELRYVTCFPVPEVSKSGVQVIDTAWDAKSADLADIADCVARALIRLSCATSQDELFQAVLADVPCSGFRYAEVTPIDPQGGCAGVLWRVYAGVRSSGAPAS